MIIERIVYCVVCLVLFGYIINKYLKSKGGMYLSLLAIQLVCMLTQLIAFFSKIYVDIFMQLYILVFSILIPAGVFVAEYLNVNFEEFLEIKLGDFYARRANYDKAIAKYKKAVSKNNNNAQTFAKLGRIYNAKGDRRTAFDRFAKAIEINRNDYRSYYEIGVIFNDMGKQADAQIVLDNSLRIKPDFTPASELLAVVLCAQNKYDEAINVYKNATRYDPDNYQLYYRMGVVRTELRDFNDAKECYEKAIELNPSLYEAYFSLGQINLLKGELEQAEKMFKKSLTSKELTAKSYYQLAKVYILNDEEIKAVTYLGYAIDIDSSYKYKAESEPLFGRIKDYITGLSMANRVMQQAENIENLKKNENKSYDYNAKKPKLVEDDISEETVSDESTSPREKLALETKRVISEDEPVNQVSTQKNSIDEVFKKEENTPKENKFFKMMKMVLGFDNSNDYEDEKENDEANITNSEPKKTYSAKEEERLKDANSNTRESIENENIKDSAKDSKKENQDEILNNEIKSKEDLEKLLLYLNTKSAEENLNSKKEELENTKVSTTNKESFEGVSQVEALDIFEKFKKLKKAEDEKAEKLRRAQKLKQIEELKQQEKNSQEAQDSHISNKSDDYIDENEPIVVRTVGNSDNEEAQKELRKLEELRKIRNFEIENKNDKFSSIDSQKENDEPNNTKQQEDNKFSSLRNQIEDEFSSLREKLNVAKVIENKTTTYDDNSGVNENFEDEDTMDEPHFDFMDRFKRK